MKGTYILNQGVKVTNFNIWLTLHNSFCVLGKDTKENEKIIKNCLHLIILDQKSKISKLLFSNPKEVGVGLVKKRFEARYCPYKGAAKPD